MQTFDAIVAGAGIWGCTVARRLAEAGKRVLVLEKRAAVGGNCRCEIDPETGIEVHTYGSHIFHTSNEEVWVFVRRFKDSLRQFWTVSGFDDIVRYNLIASFKSNNQTILHVGGRLGQYKYFDMDKSIEAALKVELE